MRETVSKPPTTEAPALSGAQGASTEMLASLKPRRRSQSSGGGWRFGTWSVLGNARARVAGPINFSRMRQVRFS